jgi:protein SCO1/2
MLSHNHRFFYLLLLSGIVIIFSFSYNIYTYISESGACNKSTNFVDGLGGPIDLIDQNETTFSLEKQNASLALLYFGYSYCPDICPYDLERNAYVKDIMDEQQLDINLVFITLDPSRDTTERLKDFSEYIHKSMIALTGSNDQIETLKNAYGVFGKLNKVDNEDQSYLVDHSTFSYLVNKNGEVLSYFNRRESPEQISEKIKCFY